MKNWFRSAVLLLIKPLAAVALVVSLVAIPLPQFAAKHALADGHKPDETPSGQLTRKSLAGKVLARDGSSISVGTHFGNVLVDIDGNTQVVAHGEHVDILDVNVGDKVVIHLNRSPIASAEKQDKPDKPDEPKQTGKGKRGADLDNDSSSDDGLGNDSSSDDGLGNDTSSDDGLGNGTSSDGGLGNGTSSDDGLGNGTSSDDGLGNGTSSDDGLGNGTSSDDGLGNGTSSDELPPAPSDLPRFRTVTALSVHVVPVKAARTHLRAIEKCKANGKRQLVDEEGQLVELEDESGDDDLDSDNGTSTGPSEPEALTRVIAIGHAGIGGLAFRGLMFQTTTTSSDDSADDGEGCEGSGDNLILLLHNGGSNGDRAVIRAAQRTEKIEERLARIIERLERQGRTDEIDRVVEKADELLEREEQRLQRTLERADVKVRRELERGLGRTSGSDDENGGQDENRGAGKGDKEPEGKGRDADRGKPEDDGNRGKGPDEDKETGRDRDKQSGGGEKQEKGGDRNDGNDKGGGNEEKGRR